MLCCPTTHSIPKNGGKEISSLTYLSNSDLSTFSFQTNHPQRSLEITTEEYRLQTLGTPKKFKIVLTVA